MKKERNIQKKEQGRMNTLEHGIRYERFLNYYCYIEKFFHS